MCLYNSAKGFPFNRILHITTSNHFCNFSVVREEGWCGIISLAMFLVIKNVFLIMLSQVFILPRLDLTKVYEHIKALFKVI